MSSFAGAYHCVCVTYSDEHAQLALAGVLGVDVELYREAGRDAAG